ncbi:hypothetical protein BLA24_26725 [Streptomyces cinnamoneus]|uniref:Uncharacterized protein n=1 Tax=Streptomyces cinnamoneus TaxID=53446 RepID=A0A2G1XEF7_STRCJ|nr:hypothetical protein [Streptomyces cinnamoneus]PHQ49617.1 hypothetical protein BLA24_26725 [Streptomyces cinnamoneus]PPT14663.1 hypothetical protein CYQ11_18910 [Streptomyces cinnamoneus]
MNSHGTLTDDELRRAWASANAADAADATENAPGDGPLGPADRDRHPWLAPGWATGLALLLVPVAVLFGGLSPMATDSCGPDHCSRALNQALAGIVWCLYATFTATPLMLLVSWALPPRMRYAAARRLAAWCALLPPLAVILMVFDLPQG